MTTEDEQVILYSTRCPKCNVLKRKLEENGVEYTEENSVDKMLSMGITIAPVLGVGEKLLNFSDAVKWINSLKEMN